MRGRFSLSAPAFSHLVFPGISGIAGVPGIDCTSAPRGLRPCPGAFSSPGPERRRRAFGQSLRVERRGVSSFRRPRSCVYTYEHERVYAGIGGHGMADVRGCSGVRGRAFRGLVCSRSRMGVRRTGVSAWGCLVACSAGFFGVSLRWPPGPGRNSVHCGRRELPAQA